MKEKYIKETQIIERSQVEKEVELLLNIQKAKKDLNTANINFEYAQEGLVDYYIYEIKANQAKLDYLIKNAKKNGIVFNKFNEKVV